MRQHVARLSTVLLGDAQIDGTIAYDNTVSGLEADTVKEAIDEVAAESGGGGGVADEVIVVDIEGVTQGSYTPVEVVVPTTHKHILIKAIKIERLSETGSPVLKAFETAQAYLGTRPLPLFNAGTMAASDLDSDVLYGPANRNMGDTASTNPVSIYTGGVGFTLAMLDNLYVYPAPEPAILTDWKVSLVVEPIAVPVGW